jgi:hypothetical protein
MEIAPAQCVDVVDRHHQITPGASLHTCNFSPLDRDPRADRRRDPATKHTLRRKVHLVYTEAEIGMSVVETIAKIRGGLFFKRQVDKEICRELRVSRKVVRKVIRSGAPPGRRQRRSERSRDRADYARSGCREPSWHENIRFRIEKAMIRENIEREYSHV